MNPQDIEKIIRSANKKLSNHFVERIKSQGLLEKLKFCFPQFSIDYKGQKYLYAVHLNYEINLGKNRYWKETARGRRLMERDPKTGEESVIISISYKSKGIYESQLDFDLNKEVETLQAIDVASLEKKPSLLKTLFSKRPKQFYVVNEEWQQLFGIKN